MLSDSLIESILTALPGKTIGLLGDLFLDRYLDLDATLTEPSIETGLDAYQVARVRSYPGALGTVLNNLVALGVGRICPVALIGDDGEGYELRQALHTFIVVDLGHVIMWEGRRTPTYTKPMLCATGQPPRELNRLDIKNRTPTPAAAQDAILASLEKTWEECDAWVVLDQVSEADCGVVTHRVRQKLERLAERSPERFVLADSRAQIENFRRVSVKPNAYELYRAINSFPIESENDVAEWLAERVGGTVFCTRGERSTLVVQRDQGDWRLTEAPSYPVTGPIDPVGAGDSVSAGITCAMLAGSTPVQAAAFGNLVASITVQQLGTTGTASPGQVRSRWRELNR
jgi:bifunctional ADP-heptose synthase (sugar kinase/adenylyltransferase)